MDNISLSRKIFRNRRAVPAGRSTKGVGPHSLWCGISGPPLCANLQLRCSLFRLQRSPALHYYTTGDFAGLAHVARSCQHNRSLWCSLCCRRCTCTETRLYLSPPRARLSEIATTPASELPANTRPWLPTARRSVQRQPAQPPNRRSSSHGSGC